MRAVRLGALCVVLLSGASPARAELPPAAQEVVRQLVQESADIDRAFDAEAGKRRERVAAELQKVLDALCRDAKLDEALAVRDAIRRLRAGSDGAAGPLPAEAEGPLQRHAEAITALRKKADDELARRRGKVEAELKKILDIFCREAKLDEAVAVRDLIRGMHDGWVRALPDPGYINYPARDIGKVMYFEVTGTRTGGKIYGTNVYATDSHLGMAAVHCGALKDGERGVVRVTILRGETGYLASIQNGISSRGCDQWQVSFRVERVDAPPSPQ
jgi:hypothetical protein